MKDCISMNQFVLFFTLPDIDRYLNSKNISFIYTSIENRRKEKSAILLDSNIL